MLRKSSHISYADMYTKLVESIPVSKLIPNVRSVRLLTHTHAFRDEGCEGVSYWGEGVIEGGWQLTSNARNPYSVDITYIVVSSYRNKAT